MSSWEGVQEFHELLMSFQRSKRFPAYKLGKWDGVEDEIQKELRRRDWEERRLGKELGRRYLEERYPVLDETYSIFP